MSATVVYRHVEPYPAWGLVALIPEWRTLVTDGDGRFEIPDVHPGPYEIYAHNAFHGSVSLRGEIDEFSDELTFAFQPTGEIRGLVTLPDDATPAAGTTLSLRGGAFDDYEVVADAEGAFTFELVPPGYYSLTAEWRDGLIFRQKRVWVSVREPGDEVDVDLSLPTQARVVGRVEDASSQPVAGAVVTLRERAFPWRTLTANADGEGNYQFHNIFAGAVHVSAQAPQLGGLGGKATGEVIDEGLDVELPIVLEGAGAISGVVIDPGDGLPAASARIELSRGGLVDSLATDAEGRFHFDLLALGTYSLTIFDPSSGRHGFQDQLVLDAHGQHLETTVHLEVRGEVEGHLYNTPSLEGIPGATVRLDSRGLKWFTVFASTDVEGAYDFGGIPEGQFLLTGRSGDRRATGEGEIQEEDEVVVVDLYLEEPVRLTGRLYAPRHVNAPDGPDVLVDDAEIVVSQTSSGFVTGVSNDNPFVLDGLLPGFTRIQGRRLADDRTVYDTRRPEPGDALDVTLRLPGRGTLDIDVVDASGQPLDGAGLRLNGTSFTPEFQGHEVCAWGNGPLRWSHDFGAGQPAETTADVGAGPFSVVVEDLATGLSGSASGCLRYEGETVAVTVALQPSGSVAGQVFQVDGTTPAVGMLVVVDPSGFGWEPQFAETDADGRFRFDGLPLRSYQLSVEEPDGPGTFTLSAALATDGEVHDHSLVLDEVDPSVVAIAPAIGAVDQPLDVVAVIEFSEPIADCGDACWNLLNLRDLQTDGWPPIDHVFAADRRSVSLVPQQPLESARAYKIVVEAGLADFAGRKLGTRVVGGFTTADVLPPAVLSFAPAEGELQVAADRNLELTFTEPIDPASLGAAITLTDLATGQVRPVTSLLTHEDRRAVLTPIGGLATDTDYRLSVVGLRDGSGNTQTVESTVTFGTLDTQAPQIAWTQPTAGAAFTSGDEITAAVTTTDLRGTASVTFTIDEWSVTLDAEPWVWSVPAPLRAASESVDIRVEAVDVYGNVATSTRSIVVDPLDDPAAPTSAAGCPIDGDFVAPGVPLVVRFTAQDDLKLERVRLLVDGVEVDRQAPVDAAALEAGLAWTPDAAALAGDTFALVLESRDFAGNVTQIPLTVSVPTGEIVVGGAETPVDLVTGPGAVVLAAGLHALPLDVSRAGVLLLDGAELVAQPNTLLDSTSEMRLQCGASAALARVEAPTVVLETASVLAPLQLETLDLTAGLLEIEAGAALDASELGYVAWHHSPSLPFAPPWMEESLDRDGGSHGGAGGDRGAETVYDSVYRPTLAGGGGGRDFYFREGPSGGGIVRLDLGELRLEGAIRADAPDIPEGAIHDNAGVGAGGSIWIDATTVSGAGTVSASAGRSSRGAGGGGRVSLVVGAFSGFDPATQVEAVGGDNRLQTADGPNPDRDFASAGTVFVRTPGQSLGTLRIDNGRQDDGSPRRAPTTFLPALGVGSVSATQQDSGDLWVVSASDFLPRWRGAWMRLLDGAGGDLGTFEVDDLDGVRARLLGASSVTGAASFEGVYRFDELILAGHQTFDAADAIEVGTLSVGPEVTIHADIESASTELLAGAVLTVTEPVVADALTLRSGSTLRTVLGTPLVLDVAGRLTIEAGASLDADGLGHWYGTSATSFVGEVPAGLMGSAPTTGGSHGGQGTRDGAGEVFDSVYFPSELGGGGGGNSHDLLADGRDGFGGGLIVVDAGELVVDGRISARGRLGVEPGGAGGAGGSIRVRAGSLAGSGVIDVGGGASDIGYDAGAGGGGRILLDVDLLDGFDVASQALAHGGLPNTVVPTPAAAGTVLLRQPSSVHGTLYLANAPAPAGATLAVPTSLPRLGSGAVVAAVAVGADLQLTLDVPARVRWLGASIELFDAQGGLLATERVLDVIGGDLLVENAALFDAAATWRGVHRFDAVHLGEGVRLITDDTVDLGAAALGTEIELLGPLTARRLTLSAGAHLRSGDLEQPLRLEIAEDLIVEAGAVIEADGTGYGPTVTLSHRGLAPDGVLGAGEDNAGSHGGVGHPGADPGEIYDAIVHPILGGGGGGSGPTFNWRPRDAGGTGGGTLEIRAGSIQLDGEIRALGVLNGGDYDQGTGGAGGSIFVAAQSLAGTGAIDASGADGWTSGGGGGRIALQVADLSAFDVATQARAAGGVRDDNGTPSHRGGAGTVFVFDQSSVDGTLRVDGEETGSLEVGATPLPQIGDGIIGLVEADLQVPADAWIEPQDPAQMFSLGVFGMYVRVDGVDYRVLAEAGDRRRILLEGAAGVVAVGDAFRGVHAFDEVQAAGGAQLEFRDFDQVDTWTIDASSTVVRLDQNAPEIVSLTPADGSSFASGDLLGIVADLTDNTAVVSAVFELAGRSVTLTEAPWVWGLAAPRVTTTTDFVLRLTATDDEGNATIATRSIQVVPTIDAIAPTVAFGACVPGSMAVEPGALHAVSVAAGDENRLERVALLVDGQLVDERLDLSITNASLDFAWTVPAGSIGGTVHQITLRAEDYAGNATEAMSAWTVPPTWLVDGDVIDPATVAGTDLALGAGTFEVDQPLALASLTLMQGATLTTAAGVPLEVTTTGDAILECGSTVNVSLRGYAGGSHGATPPGAPVDVAPASRCTGGSHGGVALWHDFGHWVEGETYGSVSLPEHAGAGGSWCSLTGGRGGGVAHLAANEIELRGDIVALGQASGYPATEFDVQQGSGAGGSILLEANRLSGGGRLDASGGAGHSFSNYPGESPGGGGRVALHVDDLSAIDVATQVTASGGGAYSWDGLLEASAGPGTVFLFDSFSTYGRLRVVGHDVQTHATRLPALGAGTVGVADADTTVPADLWIEPLDPAARFALGATGAWMRIDGVDYRILDQVDRRRILLEGAVGAVGIGDAYRGVYKFDSLEVGPQDEVIVDDDLLEVSSSSIALSATVVAGTESTPTTLSVTFAGSPDPMHLALVDWGDGASDEPTVIDDGFGGGSFSTSHPYTGSGTFTISLCVEGTTAFACTTEQVAIAVDPPVVSLPAFDFATWQVEDQLDSGTSSLWRVIDGGASVDQIRNSKPTFFASPPSGGGWAIEGQLTMSSDDDVVGFAVGFDPGGLDSAPPAEEFLLVTWRRANLNLSGYGIVPKGLEAFLVVGEPENWWALGASPEATDLGPAMTSADLGWSVGAVYDLRLEAGGENVKLWIDGSLEFDLDLDVSSLGQRIAFYGNAQERMEFRDFARTGFVGGVGSPLTLELDVTDESAPQDLTATVDWGDGSPLAGASIDLDGRLTATHAYATPGGYTATVCATDPQSATGCLDVSVTVNAPAPPRVTFGEIDLSTFTAESPIFNYNSHGDGVWTVEAHHDRVVQSADSEATFFMSQPSSMGWWVEGALYMTGDNDDVGFVLGLEPGEMATGAARAGALVWKRSTENHGTWGQAPRGLRAFDLVASPVNWWSLSVAPEALLLAEATTVGTTGWDDDREIPVQIEYGGGQLDAWFDGTQEFSLETPNWGERLGFYSHLQKAEFRHFRRLGVLATAGTPASLEASAEAIGGLAGATATIDWGDGSGAVAAALDPATGSVSGSHAYATAGTYTATVCAQDVDGLVGCTDVAVKVRAPQAPKVSFGEIDLSTFTAESVPNPYPDSRPAGSWTIENGGAWAVENVDSAPTFFISPQSPEGWWIEGTLFVPDPYNDVGLAVGLDPGELASGTVDAAVFVWRQNASSYYSSLGFAPRGLRLFEIDGNPTNWWSLGEDLDASLLATAATLSDVGWSTDTAHLLRLESGQGELKLWVDDILQVSSTSGDWSDRFAFFANLAPPEFRDFRRIGLIAATGISVDLEADVEDFGGLANLTATVDWGDGSAVAAASIDTGSGQATASHVYAATGSFTATVCAQNAAGLSTCVDVPVLVRQGPAPSDPPTVTSLVPADGASFTSGDPIDLVAVLADDTGIADATLTLGSTTQMLTSAPWTLSGVAPIVSTVSDLLARVVVTDLDGQSTTVEHTLQIQPRTDTTAPTVAFGACGADGALVEPGVEQTLQLVAADDQLLAEVEWLVDGTSIAVESGLQAASRTTEAFWTVPAGAAGGTSYLVTVRATDYAGQIAEVSRTLAVPTAWTASGDPISAAAIDGTDWVLGAGAHVAAEALAPASLHLMRGATLTSTVGTPIDLEVTGVATLECGSAIDVTALGHAGGDDSVAPAAPVGVDPAPRCSGGAHGGSGAWHPEAWSEGETFGSLFLPEHAGGGGHGCAFTGGAGGGVVRLAATTLDLRGEILARGEDADHVDATIGRQASGAGGSILIEAAFVRGGGRLDASGGRTTDEGTAPGESAGGGGRVALYIDDLSQIDLATQVVAEGGGVVDDVGAAQSAGASGTVLAVDAAATHGLLRIAGPSVSTTDTRLPALGQGTIGVADADLVTPADLWVEPLDAQATFALGAVGAWLRIDDVDYRIVDQADRRRILLENASATVSVGDAYRGLLKLDALELAGSSELAPLDDLLEVADDSAIALTLTTVDGTDVAPVDLDVAFAGDPASDWRLVVRWGDGSSSEHAPDSESGGAGTLAVDHLYATAGSYTIDVCVTSSRAAACKSATVTVSTSSAALFPTRQWPTGRWPALAGSVETGLEAGDSWLASGLISPSPDGPSRIAGLEMRPPADWLLFQPLPSTDPPWTVGSLQSARRIAARGGR
ncbi:MAG: carboxypeptidase regulatory-like domain-containing protein [Acidobacteriota bacterium]